MTNILSGGRRVLLVQKPGADASISFGVPIGALRGSDDFYALWLATSWLGEHRASVSHLFQVIRERRGMNYGDYAYVEAYPNGGQRNAPPANVGRHKQLFEVWIRTLPNDNAVFAIKAALREIQRLVDQGLTEEEFQLTRTFLKKYHLHFAETTEDRLAWRIDDAFYGMHGSPATWPSSRPSSTASPASRSTRRSSKHWNLGLPAFRDRHRRCREAQAAADRRRRPRRRPTNRRCRRRSRPKTPRSRSSRLASRPAAVRIVPVEKIFEK